MFGVGQSYITNVIGVAYPAFMSFVALESEGTEDDKQWLTYWVCFGAFNIADQFAGIILQFIPFYYFLKLGFLVYLFHPQTMGASTVYNQFIQPHLAQLEEAEKNVEEQLAKAKKLAEGKLDEAKKMAGQATSSKMD